MMVQFLKAAIARERYPQEMLLDNGEQLYSSECGKSLHQNDI